MCDPTKRETRLLDPATLKLESRGDRDQGKSKGGPVTHFQVSVVVDESFRRKINGGDDFTGPEVVVDVLECRQGDGGNPRTGCCVPLSHPLLGLYRLQSGQRDAHVRRMDVGMQ